MKANGGLRVGEGGRCIGSRNAAPGTEPPSASCRSYRSARCGIRWQMGMLLVPPGLGPAAVRTPATAQEVSTQSAEQASGEGPAADRGVTRPHLAQHHWVDECGSAALAGEAGRAQRIRRDGERGSLPDNSETESNRRTREPHYFWASVRRRQQRRPSAGARNRPPLTQPLDLTVGDSNYGE